MSMSYRIFDVDQHLCDTGIDFSPYVNKAAKEDLPRNVEYEGCQRLALGGKLFPKPTGFGRGSPSGSGAGGNLTWKERVSWSEEQNIGHALLLPGNVGMAIHAIEDIELYSQIAEGYRRWQLANWGDEKDKRFSVALLADVHSLPTIAEAEHTAVSSLFIRPANVKGTRFDSEDMKPLYRLASDTGLPIVLHSSTGYYQCSPVANKYDNYFYTHLYSHIIEMQMALGEILSSGVLEKYPEVRFVFAEAGVWWVPGFVERLIWHMKTFPSMILGDASKVLDLLYERCLFCCQVEDTSRISPLLMQNPWLRLAIGTDIPHWDAIDPNLILSSLSAADAYAVSWDNASSIIFKGNAPL